MKMAVESEKLVSEDGSNQASRSPMEVDQENGVASLHIDGVAEISCLRKLDIFLLPFLSLMYFFNSVDRSNLGNAKTDSMDKDLGFVGEQYSLLILLFYIPNGLCDLPLNILTKRWSGKIVLPSLMVSWGACALLQCATRNFGGILVLRLLLGYDFCGGFCNSSDIFP